jgi:DNA-binding phage protein
MALKLKRWNVQDHLKSGRQAAAFWEAALAECDGDAK